MTQAQRRLLAKASLKRSCLQVRHAVVPSQLLSQSRWQLNRLEPCLMHEAPPLGVEAEVPQHLTPGLRAHEVQTFQRFYIIFVLSKKKQDGTHEPEFPTPATRNDHETHPARHFWSPVPTAQRLGDTRGHMRTLANARSRSGGRAANTVHPPDPHLKARTPPLRIREKELYKAKWRK